MVRKLLAALLFLIAAPAQAEWREAESAHFIIYSEQPVQELEAFAARLEKIDGLMRIAIGLTDTTEPVKVRIYVVPSTAEVQRAIGMAGSGVAGFYDSNIFGPFAVTPRKTYSLTGAFTPELVLHHEYAHHFMLQNFPSVYPQWYVEGFAELIGSSKFLPDGKIAYGTPARHRGDAIAFHWAHARDLMLKPAREIPNLDLYGQGWALTHFLTFSPKRTPQMREYLRALKGGRTLAEAAAVFGDLDELNREARAYLSAGSFTYRPVAVEVAQPVLKKVRVLSAGEAALVPEIIAFRDDDLSLYRKVSEREREQRLRAANLSSIREKSNRFTNDPYAFHILAEAEYVAGNFGKAEAAADRLLALQPNHTRGLTRKALSMLQAASRLSPEVRAGKAAEARRLVMRANRADPNDVLPLIALYQTYSLAGQEPSKPAVDALAAAVATLPQDLAARQLLVDEMARQERWVEAIAYLLPMANSPHESPRREAARKQLEELRAKSGAGANPAAAPVGAA